MRGVFYVCTIISVYIVCMCVCYVVVNVWIVGGGGGGSYVEYPSCFKLNLKGPFLDCLKTAGTERFY